MAPTSNYVAYQARQVLAKRYSTAQVSNLRPPTMVQPPIMMPTPKQTPNRQKKTYQPGITPLKGKSLYHTDTPATHLLARGAVVVHRPQPRTWRTQRVLPLLMLAGFWRVQQPYPTTVTLPAVPASVDETLSGGALHSRARRALLVDVAPASPLEATSISFRFS